MSVVIYLLPTQCSRHIPYASQDERSAKEDPGDDKVPHLLAEFREGFAFEIRETKVLKWNADEIEH
jgi:hypothetical protein